MTIRETLEHRQGFTPAECSIAAYLLAHGQCAAARFCAGALAVSGPANHPLFTKNVPPALFSL